MVPLDEAIAHVLDAGASLPAEACVPADALGRMLANDVVAAEAIPPFANTAMDGYAVRAADVVGVPVRLPVVAEVAAGHPAPRSLAAGEAMRIFTGAPMPEGADAVVIVERTRRLDGGSAVEIGATVEPGANVRAAGEDMQPGDVVLATGDELTPARLGVLASLGLTEVLAHPLPRVAIMSTGDELTDGPDALRPGQIRDSNRPMLAALVAQAGCEPVDLGIIPDDDAAIAAALELGAATCDVVLSTGGVSMGDIDLVRVVLDRIGDMRWMQVAIKPAKPLAFGTLLRPGRDGAAARRIPVVGLPGNPVSSHVSFELFARPLLRRLAGVPDDRLHRPLFTARATERFARRADGKIHFVRVALSSGRGGVIHARSAGGQGSHQLAALGRADGLAVVPDGEGVASGEPVDVMVLSEPRVELGTGNVGWG